MTTDSNDPLLEGLLAGEAASNSLGQQLAPLLEAGDILCLWGDLGTGKSTLARALIRKLMGEDTDAPSPTFTLVQTYEAPDWDLWHMDLYRLEDPEDALELGIEDAFHDAVSLIEWPDRLQGYLPRNRLDISLFHDAGEGRRRFTLASPDPVWAKRLAPLITAWPS